MPETFLTGILLDLFDEGLGNTDQRFDSSFSNSNFLITHQLHDATDILVDKLSFGILTVFQAISQRVSNNKTTIFVGAGSISDNCFGCI